MDAATVAGFSSSISLVMGWYAVALGACASLSRATVATRRLEERDIGGAHVGQP